MTTLRDHDMLTVPPSAVTHDGTDGVIDLRLPSTAARPRAFETRVRFVADCTAMTVAAAATGHGAGWIYAANVLVILIAARAYVPRLSLRLLDDAGKLGLAFALAFVGPAPFMFADALPPWTSVAAVGAALVVGRLTVYAALRRRRARGRLLERTLIVGGGEVAQRIYKLLRDRPEFGLVPIGFADDSADRLPGRRLGRVRDFELIVADHGINQVIVSFGVCPDHALVSVLRSAATLGLDVRIVPRLFDVGVNVRHRDSETLWDIPLVRLRRYPLRTLTLKRIFDVTVAGFVVVVLSPLFLALALAVRVTSPGPIMFRQQRVGRNGRCFELLKFRSMYVNDDSDTEWSVKDADKMTPVGSFLRRSSLDELPQVWNVLRGDMSLVGPRPERPFFVDEYSAEITGYNERHRLPVGLTGWAQVHGLRGDTSIDDRARFDNYYIDNWSVFLDLKVLLYTVAETLRFAVSGESRT